MSSLSRGSGIVTLRLLSRPQLLLIRKATTPQINCRISLPSCRFFFSSPRTFRGSVRKSPRANPAPSQKPDPNPHHENIEDVSDYPKTRWYGWDNLVVGGIIGSCVLVFGYYSSLQADFIVRKTKESYNNLENFLRSFTHSRRGMSEGRYYTLITSAFMHTSTVHLAVNMFTLWGFGRTFIWTYGVPSFLAVYFGSAIAGGLFQTAVSKWQNAPLNYSGAGASGAILGIVTALSFVNPWSKIQIFFIPLPFALASALMAGVSIGGILFPKFLPSLGHGDHLGGMAYGAFWWYMSARRGIVPRIRW